MQKTSAPKTNAEKRNDDELPIPTKHNPLSFATIVLRGDADADLNPSQHFLDVFPGYESENFLTASRFLPNPVQLKTE